VLLRVFVPPWFKVRHYQISSIRWYQTEIVYCLWVSQAWCPLSLWYLH